MDLYGNLANPTLQEIAESFVNQWTSLTVASDQSHLLMNYGDQGSKGLMYNLFSDKLLQLGLIGANVRIGCVLFSTTFHFLSYIPGVRSSRKLLEY